MISYELMVIEFLAEYRILPKVTSPRTVAFHEENLEAFKIFLRLEYPFLLDDFTKIEEGHIKKYIKYMVNKGLSKYTIEGRIKTLRVFSKVLSDNDFLHDFCKNIQYRVKTKENMTPFTPSQIQVLTKNINTNDRLGIRLMAVVLVLLDTGIRLDELNNINISDVDFKHQEIFIRKAKGYKQRTIPFGRQSLKSILKYMKKFNINPNDLSAPLFQTINKDRWAKRSIQNELSILGEKARLQNVQVCPHTFRHTFALGALKNGIPGHLLMYYLGHNSMDTVNIYLKITDQLAHDMYISFNDTMYKQNNNDIYPHRPR